MFHSILYSFRLPQLTVAIELVTEISRQLMERKTDAVNEISCTFEELERVLHQRKTALITDLENICSSKQKVRNIVLPLGFFLQPESLALSCLCQVYLPKIYYLYR